MCRKSIASFLELTRPSFLSDSELYCPVLGPPIRRAVKKGFDVILDGEIVAWDSVRAETVPFGSNRTIANLRKGWMQSRGLLDDRDRGMHDGDRDNKSMNASNSWPEKNDKVSEDAGAECWLQYVVFDILYVDGPGADELLSQTVSEHILPRPTGGSIIHLEAFDRKKVLFKMLEPLAHQVEIVQTWIIRPNGLVDSGERYFDPRLPTTECGYAAHTLDSLSCTLSGTIRGIPEIDVERRHDISDEEISQARAYAIQGLYDTMVEEQRLEGLVFKDLSAPYFLGEESKSTRYWHKFKPDYFNGSVASDLDVIIIAGYYATGLRQSGKPSAVLCACVDSEDPERFLPLCKVSLGSIDRMQSNELLRATGYPGGVDDDEDGSGISNKWENSDWAAKYFPEFVSSRSFQSGNDGKGWRVQKKDCKSTSSTAIRNCLYLFNLLTCTLPILTQIQICGFTRTIRSFLLSMLVKLWKVMLSLPVSRYDSRELLEFVKGPTASNLLKSRAKKAYGKSIGMFKAVGRFRKHPLLSSSDRLSGS